MCTFCCFGKKVDQALICFVAGKLVIYRLPLLEVLMYFHREIQKSQLSTKTKHFKEC